MVTKRALRAKPIVMLVVLFVLGIATGVFGTIAFVHQREARSLKAGPRGFEERRMRGLTRRLDLDDTQREQVRALLEKNREDGRALSKKMMDECGGPIRQRHAAFQTELRKLLRPEQVVRFEELEAERRGSGPLGELAPPPPFP